MERCSNIPPSGTVRVHTPRMPANPLPLPGFSRDLALGDPVSRVRPAIRGRERVSLVGSLGEIPGT
jgi:hypothetical protein